MNDDEFFEKLEAYFKERACPDCGGTNGVWLRGKQVACYECGRTLPDQPESHPVE